MSGCCGSNKAACSPDSGDGIRTAVRDAYGRIGENGVSLKREGSCCGGGKGSTSDLALAVGYDAAELAALPEGANLGLSCGNPTAIAALAEGEVVLDLGSGGGFDIFIAARKVGPTGRAIGVDMTPRMLERARANAVRYREAGGADNVEFRLGEIENLPAADNSVDVVISNCVINLSPDKPRVWREIARVLRPGGRVAVSDLALLKPLPGAVKESVAALVGCVAGAALVEETRSMALEAGLSEVALTPKSAYVESMTDWNDPLYLEIIKHLPEGDKVSDYVTSLYVNAIKPS